MDVRMHGGSGEVQKTLIMGSNEMNESDEEREIEAVLNERELEDEDEEEPEEDDDDDDELPPGVIPRYKSSERMVMSKSGGMGDGREDEENSEGYLILTFNASGRGANMKAESFRKEGGEDDEEGGDPDMMKDDEEDNEQFYGEAFWVGAEGEADNDLKPAEAPLLNPDILASWEADLANVHPHLRPSSLFGGGTGPPRGSLPIGSASTTHKGRGRPRGSGVAGVHQAYFSAAVQNQVNTSSGSAPGSTSMNASSAGGGGGRNSGNSGGGGASVERGNMGPIIGLSNPGKGKRMLKCERCAKYYRNQYSLRHHICLPRKDVWKKGDIRTQVIDGQLYYYCPTCDKSFKWLGNLTRHFYVHTGQRFFKCEVCNKEFFSAYQVKRHMNSHTGMRFKCEVCDKPFTCKYACAWHTRQHYTYVE